MKFHIIVECGETTCAAEPGKFCRFVYTQSFGTRFICNLYNEPLFDEGGWLQRLKQCKEELRIE